ncbi:MAG TPA: Ppx/GppA phosphatase family protein [Polyangiales bacterium]|nr:Ppx/GppA phosphatase family protein [Polyangiales bacterium]
MNVAAIDIGTNSVRLLITSADGRELAREMRITRLGQGVDVAGTLHPDAIQRTVDVLAGYRSLIEQHDVKRVRATATSAARDAKNSQDFFDAAERALGHRPQLIRGEEEAELSFRGATDGLKEPGPYLVIDIGGGSTEFVLGSEHPEQVISVNMGCVRMAERHLKSDPATPAQLDAVAKDARALLVEVRNKVDVARANTVVGLAGTITALAYLHRGLKTYSPADTHRTWLARADVEAAYEKLAQADVEQRRALLVEPKRAEVIVGGAAVLVTLMRELQIEELLVSENDILDGIAASLRD